MLKSSTFVQILCLTMRVRFFTLVFAVFVLASCGSRYETLRGYAQGGLYSVQYNARGVSVPRRQVQAAVDGILYAVDTTLSGYNRKSLLSRRNAGEEVELNDMFRDILELSGYYHDLSGGAFDVAAGPLFDIWGFGFTTDSLPSDDTIAAAMERCRRQEVLNFNAIAQGYSCDLVAGYLHSIGVHDMLVDIGEIYCEGLNPEGRGWTIGIDTPSDDNDTPGKDLSGIWKSGGGSYGVVTSGNYRKFYVRDGKKYAHTIDPRTGRPVEHNLLSATVIAPNATEADALATYFMVAGLDEARSFVESHPGIEAFLICSDSSWKSPGF